MIDHFTQAQFEAALPVHKNTGQTLWTRAGIIEGEFTYLVPVPNRYYQGSDVLGIIIRSSVRPGGQSAGTGEDSIRCWLIDQQTGKPQSSKLQKYVTRKPGWQKRLADMLRKLYKIGMRLSPCPGCGGMRRAFRVRANTVNKGRIFQNCEAGCSGGFSWIELDSSASEAAVKSGELPPDYGIGVSGKHEQLQEEGKGE